MADEKIFFFHIPKCGGTRVWTTFRQIFGGDNVCEVTTPKAHAQFVEMSASQRESYRVVGGHWPFQLYQELLELQNYRSVTLIREPVSRVLSDYYYTSRTESDTEHSIVSRLSLTEYVSQPQWSNKMTTLLCGLPNAQAALQTIDELFDRWYFISEMEQLTTEICRLAETAIRPAEHRNSGPLAIEPEIDASIAALIRRQNEADIELYARLSEWRADKRATSRSQARVSSAYSDGPSKVRSVDSTAQPPVFQVVTPCLNAAPHIGETIHSVVGQAGAFSIRYHVQDGGSTDGTIEIIKRWQNLLETGQFPVMCLGVSLSMHDTPDDGMYEAVAKGFDHLAPSSHDLMTWINADDRLAPSAMTSVASVFKDLPQIELVGGRTALMEEDGSFSEILPPNAYSRECMAAGLYDGRILPFIMQEGTFWRARLWHQAGGVDPGFKLAGDWDLWRRFADRADYITLDKVTGFHRRRKGQLSGDLRAYHQELDSKLSALGKKEHTGVHEALSASYRARIEDAKFPLAGRIARRRSGRWLPTYELSPRPSFENFEDTWWDSVVRPPDGYWKAIVGFDGPEGPFPNLGIQGLAQWTIKEEAAFKIFSERRGKRRLVLDLSGPLAGENVEASIGHRSIAKTLCGELEKTESLSLEHDFTQGWNCILLRTKLVQTPGRQIGVLIRSVKFDEGRNEKVIQKITPLQAAHAAHAVLAKKLQAIEQSTSWHVTRPLRGVVSWMRARGILSRVEPVEDLVGELGGDPSRCADEASAKDF
jgi:hypothetical protein